VSGRGAEEACALGQVNSPAALLERGDHLVLLGRAELDEGLVEVLGAIGMERRGRGGRNPAGRNAPARARSM
jgi:hypothetical protein